MNYDPRVVALDECDKHPELLERNTDEDAGTLTEYVVNALAAVDSDWGHVGKRPGQTQYRGHAVDAVMRRSDSEVRDFLALAGAGSLPRDHRDFGKPARFTWDKKDSGGQPWMAPIPVAGEPTPPPNPPPNQPPSGGNIEARLAVLERLAIKHGDKISLRTWDQAHFICTEGGGGGDVNATRTEALGWETLTVEKQ
jgi:hypothetical protein